MGPVQFSDLGRFLGIPVLLELFRDIVIVQAELPLLLVVLALLGFLLQRGGEQTETTVGPAAAINLFPGLPRL